MFSAVNQCRNTLQSWIFSVLYVAVSNVTFNSALFIQRQITTCYLKAGLTFSLPVRRHSLLSVLSCAGISFMMTNSGGHGEPLLCSLTNFTFITWHLFHSMKMLICRRSLSFPHVGIGCWIYLKLKQCRCLSHLITAQDTHRRENQSFVVRQ